MKIKFTLVAVFALLMIFTTVSAQEEAEFKVYNKNVQIALSTPIVSANNQYYIAVDDLQQLNLRADSNGRGAYIQTDWHYFRYTMLEIDYNSNHIYINGKNESYENAYFHNENNDMYYISIDLIARAYSLQTDINAQNKEIHLHINSGNVIGLRGTVYLPDNQTAPEGGLTAALYIQDGRSSGSGGFGTSAGFSPGEQKPDFPRPTLAFPSGGWRSIGTVTIPSGENSAAYRLEVDMRSIHSPIIKLAYKITGDYLGAGISPYIETRYVQMIEQDIQLTPYFKRQTISGTVTLPETIAEDEEVYFSVCATGGEGDSYFTNTYNGCIQKDEEGMKGAEYSIDVRNGIEYEIEIIFENGKYMRDKRTAVFVSDSDVENIHFNAMPARKVSGTLSLPKGQTAKTDLEVTAVLQSAAKPYYYLGFYHFVIPAGSDWTEAFPFELYDDMGVDTAIVFYNAWSENFPDNNLFKWGHYKGNGGTKSQVNAAEILNLTQGDISGLEMSMLKGRGAAEKFRNASTDDSANNGAFAVMQNAASPAPQKVSRANIQNAAVSIEPEQNLRIFPYYESVEGEDGVWEDVYTLILPEDCENYSFGLYSDTHDKQFYWDGNEFIEEFSNSEIYDFNEIENLQFAYNGYSADLPVRVLDLRYNATFGHCFIDVEYASDFASEDFNIYVAAYDKYERLKEILMIPQESMDKANKFEIEAQFTQPLSATDFIKVFAWKNNLSPLAELYQYPIV